jgi:dipeptidyl aminopeptidase/acylaminoacyl peptidase
MAERGVVAVAVSQPGYGKSDGPPDYAGPSTQAAMAAVIERMRQESYVVRDRVGLFGYSRGAIAAAMLATRIRDLRVLILGAGIYDLKDRYERLDRSSPQLAGIAANIEQEAGTSAQAFRARSVLHIVQAIKATTLLLHGANDDRSPLDGTEKFARKLKEGGTRVELKIFPEAGHFIPIADQEQAINAFLDRWLLTRE